MVRVDESILNYDLIEDVITTLLLKPADSWKLFQIPSGANVSRGSVLVILPGIGEIRTLLERLEGSREFGNRDAFDIIPLHSSLSSEDNLKAFRAIPESSMTRKIILATNIVETSVTIPDVVFGKFLFSLRQLSNTSEFN
jgi:HrpA-like RNA helicase